MRECELGICQAVDEEGLSQDISSYRGLKPTAGFARAAPSWLPSAGLRWRGRQPQREEPCTVLEELQGKERSETWNLWQCFFWVFL